MRRKSGIIHAEAECQDCGWGTGYRNALGNAAQHAQRTGHTVVADQCISVEYNPKGDPPSDAGEAAG